MGAGPSHLVRHRAGHTAIAIDDCANGFAGSTSAIVQWTQRDGACTGSSTGT